MATPRNAWCFWRHQPEETCTPGVPGFANDFSCQRRHWPGASEQGEFPLVIKMKKIDELREWLPTRGE
jgi:hypothetical protein